jgi:putative NIF3 family GTP cyclohydrolase 1 type 2
VLSTIADYLDAVLGTDAIPDYPGAFNGVQLSNEGPITRIAASVDVSRRVIDAAIRSGSGQLAARPSRGM